MLVPGAGAGAQLFLPGKISRALVIGPYHGEHAEMGLAEAAGCA